MNPLKDAKKKKEVEEKKVESRLGVSQPSTPPPSCVSSPRASPVFGENVKKDLKSEENLVHIKVLDIDSRSPEFHSRHNCTNRFVDVDFNTLDIMFNLQTWVIVLDFFGIGSGPSQVPKSAPVTRRVHPRPGQPHQQGCSSCACFWICNFNSNHLATTKPLEKKIWIT